MPSTSISVRKKAKALLADHSLGPDQQTRIALFIQGVKGINAAVLAKIEFQPFEWAPYRFLHNQYFKEVELSTLIGRATEWSTNPMVYMEATSLNLALWEKTEAAKYMQAPFQVDALFYEYLALSHAFMADIRFLPLLPAHLPLDTPFLAALAEIEEENGRQIQSQIRLLKDLDIGLSDRDKEQLIDSKWAVVEGLYDRLLSEVTASIEQQIQQDQEAE
ncbi:hypothetical protein H0Z60_06940 [Ectothiorhodospiraceae bacterium WFHF3C12]|nr:hypothetical protein [Ectothiorhodospiraceae bacterium WFHF3C12]